MYREDIFASLKIFKNDNLMCNLISFFGCWRPQSRPQEIVGFTWDSPSLALVFVLEKHWSWFKENSVAGPIRKNVDMIESLSMKMLGYAREFSVRVCKSHWTATELCWYLVILCAFWHFKPAKDVRHGQFLCRWPTLAAIGNTHLAGDSECSKLRAFECQPFYLTRNEKCVCVCFCNKGTMWLCIILYHYYILLKRKTQEHKLNNNQSSTFLK